ncbi:hypothetical protein [Lactobacillus intestinalis]|uniref:hypothetical protein n=1 Tax=Lactobacillus intestinalis TaxID=151781 RepID=UPI003F6787EE
MAIVGHDRFVWNRMLDMMTSAIKNNKRFCLLKQVQAIYLLKPLKERNTLFEKIAILLVLHAASNEFLKSVLGKNFFKDKTRHCGSLVFNSRKIFKDASYTGKSIVKIAGRRYLLSPKAGLY